MRLVWLYVGLGLLYVELGWMYVELGWLFVGIGWLIVGPDWLYVGLNWLYVGLDLLYTGLDGLYLGLEVCLDLALLFWLNAFAARKVLPAARKGKAAARRVEPATWNNLCNVRKMYEIYKFYASKKNEKSLKW